MENQEIMTNEVFEVAEEIIPASGKGLKALGVSALVAGLAFGAYKFIKKRKAKKEEVETKVIKSAFDEDEDVSWVK